MGGQDNFKLNFICEDQTLWKKGGGEWHVLQHGLKAEDNEKFCYKAEVAHEVFGNQC